MKQTLIVALLVVSSSIFAQPAEQQRRPAYQGYGTPVPTPEPEFLDGSEEQAEASVNLKLEAELASEPSLSNEQPLTAGEIPAIEPDTAVDVEADTETGLETTIEFAAQPVELTEPSEPSVDEAPAEILTPVIESSPLSSEPTAPPRVIAAPPATLRMNDDRTMSSVISPAETATDSTMIETTPEAEPEPIPAAAVKLSPARWQLDIVVFRAGGPQALRAERWDRNPGRPDVEQFDVISNSDANSLLEVIGRLDTSPAHQPLLQRTLVFDQLPDFLRTRGAAFETTQAIIDADLVRGHSTMPTPASRFDWPEVLGTVKLKQGADLSVSVDLLFTYTTALPYRADDTDDPFLEGGFELPADENLYQLGHIWLQQTAAANTGKLLYFDNPAIGAIVNITELTPQPIEPPPAVFAETTAEVPDDNELPGNALDDGTTADGVEAEEAQNFDTFEADATSEATGELESEVESEVEIDADMDVETVDEPVAPMEPIPEPENTEPTTPAGP